MVKKDCFAWNEEKFRCNALTKILCLKGECSFYKTKKQHEADMKKYPYNTNYKEKGEKNETEEIFE